MGAVSDSCPRTLSLRHRHSSWQRPYGRIRRQCGQADPEEPSLVSNTRCQGRIQLTMAIFDRRTASAATTLLLIALGLAIAWIAWKTLVVLLFALLFAYLMEPVVRWFVILFK